MEYPIWLDRQNETLSWEEYGYLHSFRSYCRVDEAVIGPFWISTVWLGINMAMVTMSRTPVVFETMIFLNRGELESALHPELRPYMNSILRYSSEEDALAGHAAVCVDIRMMVAKIESVKDI